MMSITIVVCDPKCVFQASRMYPMIIQVTRMPRLLRQEENRSGEERKKGGGEEGRGREIRDGWSHRNREKESKGG